MEKESHWLHWTAANQISAETRSAGPRVVDPKIRTPDFTVRIEQTHTCGKRGPAAAQRQKGHCTRDGERTPRRRGAGFEGQQQEYPPTHQTLDTCGASTSATQGVLQQTRSRARSSVSPSPRRESLARASHSLSACCESNEQGCQAFREERQGTTACV